MAVALFGLFLDVSQWMSFLTARSFLMVVFLEAIFGDQKLHEGTL